MSEAPVKIADVAKVVRSKNSGPFEITLDVFFRDKDDFERTRNSGEINKKRIAELYGIDEKDVREITFFHPANALKITLKRWVGSAAPGDTDVFGAQQHVPLMNLVIDKK